MYCDGRFMGKYTDLLLKYRKKFRLLIDSRNRIIMIRIGLPYVDKNISVTWP